MTSRSNPLERVAPYAVCENVLPQADLAELIDFAVANEDHFEASLVGASGKNVRVDGNYRLSRGLPGKHFQPWRGRIKQVFTDLLPDIIAQLGLKPFDPICYEIELVRHNDGDFFRRHIDTATQDALPGRRAISILLYFHAEPKAFEGGALRLYSIAREDVFADIEPAQNRLVAFASWIPHEVTPISCPSRKFTDSRFAINCWARMATPEEAARTSTQS